MVMKNQDTIYNDDLRRKTRKKQKRNRRHVKFYLSFMTIVLLACVIQVAYSALLNIFKIVVYNSKISKSQELKQQAELKNRRLKNELKNSNSLHTAESIARNNLKMAGENEVLVIISTPKTEVKPKTKKEEFIEYFEKNIANKFLPNENSGGSNFILPE